MAKTSTNTYHADGPCPLLTCLETGLHDHPVCPECGALDFGNFHCQECKKHNVVGERLRRYRREGRLT